MLNKPDTVVALFAKALKISQEDAKALYAKGSSPEAKALLMKITKAAFHEGTFGLPWFIGSLPFLSNFEARRTSLIKQRWRKVEKETFWGFDHLARWQTISAWRDRKPVIECNVCMYEMNIISVLGTNAYFRNR